MVKSRKFVLCKQFEGAPKPTDLQLVEEELPPLKDGEFLAEAVFISVDPNQRAYSIRLSPGATFIGSQVAKIVVSRNERFPAGKYIVAKFGWRTHTISDGRKSGDFPPPWIIPDFEGLPLSYALGILGMPGNTAYFGFLEICQPKSGETAVVTAAGGAVGSIVGQIAKIKGCRVVGIAGSDEKGKWLIDELNFDHFVNHKHPDFVKLLEEATPDGVDCYFDNVGGEISQQILQRMSDFGRISVCGSISDYNNLQQAQGDYFEDKSKEINDLIVASYPNFTIIRKQLKIEGFLVHRWSDRWFEGISQLKIWLKNGKLVYRETVTEGFENMFEAFIGMLSGDNIGKAIVKV